jgi:glutamine amidotransferase
VIALIDYKAGNLTSVKKALATIGADVFVPAAPGDLFGICLGMQWLFEGSEEAPDLPGLGLLAGRCYRLGGTPHSVPASHPAPSTPRLAIKVPHVGWNSLAIRREGGLLDQVTEGSQVYFTHSYVAPVTGDSSAVTEHGDAFAAAVQRGHIGGVQFHPEKSGDVGLRILRNFVELAG